MKIGILTFHRAHNYGAVLQCYALQEVIKSMGYEVEVIDYRQPYIEKVFKTISIIDVKRKIVHPRAFLNYLKNEIPLNKKKKQNFNQFCNKYLNLSESFFSINKILDYDCFVIGSDQVWGMHCLGGKLDPIFFGNFPHPNKSKIIGYAISTNEKSLRSIPSSKLSCWLNNFSALSLRENNMSNILAEITNVKSHIDLDPTLILDREKWNFDHTTDWQSKKYVLVYYVNRRYGKYAHEEILRNASSIANKIGAEVIDLSSMDYSVSDFVMSFKFAQCVITSSFHATVFSLIFNTPLYAVKLHDGHDGRYVNLLESLCLSNCIIDLDDHIEVVPSIDYKYVNKKLEEFRKPSIEYLRNNLYE